MNILTKRDEAYIMQRTIEIISKIYESAPLYFNDVISDTVKTSLFWSKKLQGKSEAG